jgi:hypothetical protein
MPTVEKLALIRNNRILRFVRADSALPKLRDGQSLIPVSALKGTEIKDLENPELTPLERKLVRPGSLEEVDDDFEAFPVESSMWVVLTWLMVNDGLATEELKPNSRIQCLMPDGSQGTIRVSRFLSMARNHAQRAHANSGVDL